MKTKMKQIAVLIAAAFAALAASACCILPAVLGVVGAGTLGFSAALEPYRPYFMGLTVLLLGAAFYFVYRPAQGVACEAGQCATAKTASLKSFSKVLLWGITLFAVGTMAYPQFAVYRAEVQAASASPVQTIAASAATRTAIFSVGKMTCAACSPQIADALKKTPGVRDAKVDFKTKRATVRYDAARVSVPQLRKVIENIGYTVSETREG